MVACRRNCPLVQYRRSLFRAKIRSPTGCARQWMVILVKATRNPASMILALSTTALTLADVARGQEAPQGQQAGMTAPKSGRMMPASGLVGTGTRRATAGA